MFAIAKQNLQEQFGIKALDRVMIAMVLLLSIMQFSLPQDAILKVMEISEAYMAQAKTFPLKVNPKVRELLVQEFVPTVLAVEKTQNQSQTDNHAFGILPQVENKANQAVNASPEGNLFIASAGVDFVPMDGQTPRAVMNVIATAYNSEIAQTDDTPCVTANGFNVCEARAREQFIVANNCLGFDAKVRFPKLHPEQMYTVKDRMNARFNCHRVDIWLADKQAAETFGVQETKMEVYSAEAETKP